MAVRRMAAPQTRDAPQTPVSQGKREVLGDWYGQLRQLPPPSVGIAPTCCVGLTYSRAGGSKAVMPPDNTAQIFEKGIKEKPAPVTFPHRMRVQNRLARAFPFACGMQDLTPPGKPAAQRVPSGRIATNKAAGAERGDKNAGKH